jgi:murein DD-endopeptidase MepM/ murein hydrolase activator NlpD
MLVLRPNLEGLSSQLPRIDNIPEFNCPAPILSRLERHLIKQGETVEGIANSYGLLPETLKRLNPILEQNPLPVGQEIQIPPFNGIRLEVPAGVTWQELAKAYGVRQDVLFELNGCVKTPTVVFIPGVSWYSSQGRPHDYTGLSVYPLPATAEVGLSYGWHDLPNSGTRFFHSGVDLLAPIGTSVLAAEDGIVAFVGNEGNYGFVAIINHPGGIQTRYAHLSRVNIKVESEVRAGDVIGAVGTTGKPDIKASHLHFEVRSQTPQGWIAQEPALHLPQK